MEVQLKTWALFTVMGSWLMRSCAVVSRSINASPLAVKTALVGRLEEPCFESLEFEQEGEADRLYTKQI